MVKFPMLSWLLLTMLAAEPHSEGLGDYKSVSCVSHCATVRHNWTPHKVEVPEYITLTVALYRKVPASLPLLLPCFFFLLQSKVCGMSDLGDVGPQSFRPNPFCLIFAKAFSNKCDHLLACTRCRSELHAFPKSFGICLVVIKSPYLVHSY